MLLPNLSHGAVRRPVKSANLPGAADASRIIRQDLPSASVQDSGRSAVSISDSRGASMPKNAKNIKFNLKAINLDGVTVYGKNELSYIYKEYLNTQVSLEKIYAVADAITNKYRKDGYFLSATYLPDQEIKSGSVTIKVIEAGIEEVDIKNQSHNSFIVEGYIKRLKRDKITKFADLESFLLRMNDLPGQSYRAVLSRPAKKQQKGRVILTLIPQATNPSRLIAFDNNRTRYLGPQEVMAMYSDSPVPFHKFSINALSDISFQYMQLGKLNYDITVAPNTTFSVSASRVNAKLGYTLKEYDVRSTANALSASMAYQVLRQRQKNLYLKVILDSSDSTTEILGLEASKDKTRILRANFTYDNVDSGLAYNSLSATYSRGLPSLGATKSTDNISRPGVKSSFDKVYAVARRIQPITSKLSLSMGLSKQFSRNALYPSEQFSYGGEEYGRAFDSGEIAGDQATAASAELRYSNNTKWQNVAVTPFIFYDVARLITYSTTDADASSEDAQSLGFGMRFISPKQHYGSIAFAYPIGPRLQTPIYGQSNRGPRIMLSIGKSF